MEMPVWLLVLWVLAPGSLWAVYQCLGEFYCLLIDTSVYSEKVHGAMTQRLSRNIGCLHHAD